MAVLSLEQLECDGAGFRAPRTHAKPDRLRRVFPHLEWAILGADAPLCEKESSPERLTTGAAVSSMSRLALRRSQGWLNWQPK
jgi:hypothetical protein